MTHNLNTTLANCWQMLSRGALDKKSPLRTPVIGTIEKDVPQLRTIVLRKTDAANRLLYFYTDIRSAKVQQLVKNNKLTWLFYHPKKNVQIRAIGETFIHHQNDIALRNWKNIPTYGRKTYGTTQAPSTILDAASDDLPDSWKSESISLIDTEYAYANFAVVVCEIHELEWLHLQRTGHQRAKFVFNNNWMGYWVVP